MRGSVTVEPQNWPLGRRATRSEPRVISRPARWYLPGPRRAAEMASVTKMERSRPAQRR